MTSRAALARQRGQKGEDAAAAHLQKQGMRILARNWRHGRLELDIICTEGDTVVFVEVKTRDAAGLAAPADALTPRKRGALTRAAQAWIAAHDAWHRPCRFDVISVLCGASDLTLEHYRHAFDLSAPVGGGNTPWQPW